MIKYRCFQCLSTDADATFTSSNANKLALEFKNHSAYILFISSLKANYTKIKYDECLQKYQKIPCNRNIAFLSYIRSKNPKIIENEIIQQLIKMKAENFSYSTVSVHIDAIYHFFP